MYRFKKIAILTFALLEIKTGLAQQADKTYTFKEVGWTITLPSDFKTLDSTENAKHNQKGLKAIEESTDITADIKQMKTLIAATKNSFNYFNCTINRFDPKMDGRYDSSTKLVKDIVYKTFVDQMPNAKIDSVTTSADIDGLTFDKFHVTISINESFKMNMFLLSKYYKGYDFGISYLYLDDTTREQIESMIKNSKFKK